MDFYYDESSVCYLVDIFFDKKKNNDLAVYFKSKILKYLYFIVKSNTKENVSYYVDIENHTLYKIDDSKNYLNIVMKSIDF